MQDYEKKQQEDIQEALRLERKDAGIDIEDFGALLCSKGWQRLVEIAESQAKTRENLALYSTDRALAEQDYTRDRLTGEMIGIRLFMRMPKDIVEQSEILLKEYADDVED